MFLLSVIICLLQFLHNDCGKMFCSHYYVIQSHWAIIYRLRGYSTLDIYKSLNNKKENAFLYQRLLSWGRTELQWGTVCKYIMISLHCNFHFQLHSSFSENILTSSQPYSKNHIICGVMLFVVYCKFVYHRLRLQFSQGWRCASNVSLKWENIVCFRVLNGCRLGP